MASRHLRNVLEGATLNSYCVIATRMATLVAKMRMKGVTFIEWTNGPRTLVGVVKQVLQKNGLDSLVRV